MGGPSLRALLALAWPIVLSRATQVVVGLADVAMVAHLGPDAVAATGAGAVDSWVAVVLPLGVVFVVQSFSAQYAGRGDLASARRFAWYGLLLAAVAQVLSLGLIPALGPMFGRLPYEPGVRELVVGYVAWRLLGTGAGVGVEALNAYYGGLGRTWPGMVANTSAMSANLLLNAVFVWGWFGGPEWGVAGAAIASALSVWLAFAGFAVWFSWEGLAAPWPALRLAEGLRLVRYGLPSGLNFFFEFLAFLVFVNVVVASLGTEPLAAWNAVMNLSSAAFMPAFGLASAGAVLVGQAIGAGRKDDVGRIVRLVLWCTCTWQGLVGVGCVVAPDLLMAPFSAEGDGVRQAGVGMLLVAAAWQLFDATATTYAEALRAAGDTQFPMWARLVVAWCVFAPGSWAAVTWWGWGPTATAGWLVVYLAILAVVLAWRFHGGAWRSVTLVEDALVTEVPGP
jgi:MATE family multidrug resistance protein